VRPERWPEWAGRRAPINRKGALLERWRAHVRYIQKGAIKLSVLSRIGKEAVVAMLAAGDFFGEGALADQSVRIGTATAVVASSVLIIEKEAKLQRKAARPDAAAAGALRPGPPPRTLPKISQETLAETIGATRSRVTFFMNKFRTLGLIEYHYNGGLEIHSSLLSIVLRD
jgi:CRP/FNR family cyclic AMP-dependent transcriptional regulator